MERYKEIERSIIKRFRKEIWAKFVKAVKDYNYPIIKNPCPADGHTKRQDVKMLIKNLNGTFPNLKDKLFSALNNKEQLFIWDKEEIDKINSKI